MSSSLVPRPLIQRVYRLQYSIILCPLMSTGKHFHKLTFHESVEPEEEVEALTGDPLCPVGSQRRERESTSFTFHHANPGSDSVIMTWQFR